MADAAAAAAAAAVDGSRHMAKVSTIGRDSVLLSFTVEDDLGPNPRPSVGPIDPQSRLGTADDTICRRILPAPPPGCILYPYRRKHFVRSPRSLVRGARHSTNGVPVTGGRSPICAHASRHVANRRKDAWRGVVAATDQAPTRRTCRSGRVASLARRRLPGNLRFPVRNRWTGGRWRRLAKGRTRAFPPSTDERRTYRRLS